MTAPSWDLSIAFQSLDDQKLVDTVASIEQRITDFSGSDITLDVNDLQQAIIEKESISVQMATVASYGNCIASVDASNAQAKAIVN